MHSGILTSTGRGKRLKIIRCQRRLHGILPFRIPAHANGRGRDGGVKPRDVGHAPLPYEYALAPINQRQDEHHGDMSGHYAGMQGS